MYNPTEVKWPGVFSVATRILLGRVVTCVVEGTRGDMKPTREDFVAGEGTTDGLHEGSGELTGHDHGAGDEGGLNFDQKRWKARAPLNVTRERIGKTP
jgi:hypothetical protein